MNLSQLLVNLSSQGCYPGIRRCGENRWRAHINCTGNRWAESTTPLKALRAAEKAWRDDGKPMDGIADGGA